MAKTFRFLGVTLTVRGPRKTPLRRFQVRANATFLAEDMDDAWEELADHCEESKTSKRLQSGFFVVMSADER